MKKLPPSLHPLKRRFAALFSLTAILVLTLAACGGGSDPSPTPTILPTGSVQEPISTPLPGQTTVGMLADRIAAAWPTVSAIRQVYSTSFDSATPTASPTASNQYEVVTEVDADGNKQITVTAMGIVFTQLIAIRGQIWVWGFYEALNIPDSVLGDPFGDGWMSVDTAAASGDATFNQLVLNLLSPFPVVYSGLNDAQRARVVEPLGQQVIDGRTCTSYRIPNTTETGQAYDDTLSLDETGLPCSIVTTGLGQTTTISYEFNTPIEISAPSTTPSTPSASPAAAS